MNTTTGVDPHTNTNPVDPETDVKEVVEQSPTTSQTDEKSSRPETVVDVEDLHAKIEELEKKLSERNRENATKRHKVKSIEQQYEEIASDYESLKADVAERDKTIESMKSQLKEFRKSQDAEKDRLLASMKPEHQEKFKSYSLQQLQEIYSEFYTDKPAPRTSQGAKKPADTSTVENESLSPRERIRRAYAKG